MSDLFLPVAGTITEVNASLANNPELVNTDPYGEGWMIKMTVEDISVLESLMDAEGYKAIVA